MVAKQAPNVIPDAVAKHPDAELAIVFVRFPDGLSKDDVVARLTTVKELTANLEQRRPAAERTASIIVGLGRRLFARFPELDANMPVAFRESWDLHAPDLDVDLVLHATITEENLVPQLLNGLRTTPQDWVHHERGARTRGDREVFGQRDGLRGVPRSKRGSTVFVSADASPTSRIGSSGAPTAPISRCSRTLQLGRAWTAPVASRSSAGVTQTAPAPIYRSERTRTLKGRSPTQESRL